jgi:hypothetical protein
MRSAFRESPAPGKVVNWYLSALIRSLLFGHEKAIKSFLDAQNLSGFV